MDFKLKKKRFMRGDLATNIAHLVLIRK